MPNLTIKPVAAAGNKLILQDQAGGAVLTTADSGATIANATLTTPTIASMANCTFPAGHVIQFVTELATPSTSSTSTTYIDIETIAITPLSTSSKLIITVCSGSSEGGSWTYHRILEGSSNQVAQWNKGGWAGQMANSWTHSGIYVNSTLATKTFKYQAKTDSGTGYYGYSNANSYMSVMEVE